MWCICGARLTGSSPLAEAFEQVDRLFANWSLMTRTTTATYSDASPIFTVTRPADWRARFPKDGEYCGGFGPAHRLRLGVEVVVEDEPHLKAYLVQHPRRPTRGLYSRSSAR